MFVKMKQIVKRYFLFISLFVFLSNGFSIGVKTPPLQNAIVFTENKNQWPAQVKYNAEVGNGTTLFMENDRFTFVKYDPSELEKIHDKFQNSKTKNKYQSEVVHLHAFQMNFVGSDPDVEISAQKKVSFYYNYFIGNDPSKWASEVGSYAIVNYKNVYPDIDINAYQQGKNFKYDFVVAAGGDPSKIILRYNGVDKLSIKNNRLIIQTSVGDLIENIPYSYQLINGIKKEVRCQYELSGDGTTISFKLPDGYNTDYSLVIDPVLVGATYTGSANTSTYGHCAAYDPAGNIYTGGQCWGIGYPVTVGAFQSSFGGGCDIAISKFNPNASSLIYATYLGGTADDVPNSLFIPANGEIYVLGASLSSNYPTSAGCFDNSYNGSTDITVTHLNSTGTALIGSTYIGGSQTEGGGSVPWSMNYHDSQRGEIIVDGAGNAWVASFTNSSNFPTTAGAYNQTINGTGTYDGCAFRLSPNLSALQWSTFLGGSSEDGAYALRLNSAGQLYVTGCTESPNFPNTAGAYDQTFNGGPLDGFITRFNATGTSVLASTFFGTTMNDISYFLDMDGSGSPYIYGSSAGVIPITAGVYSNPGSSNFVSKFNSGLTSLMFSTVFGDGSSSHLEPSAFMVDSCQNVYMSGFGSTTNYPVTSTALFSSQSLTNGGSCYFFVLSKDALTQLYGSFYYGTHVDGGTSRFDPSGTIYQGICMPPGGAVTPTWAYDDGSLTSSYNLFVVKIDFQMAGVNAIASVAPNDTVCLGTPVNFVNTSNGANYQWNFGDGTAISTSTSPSHVYSAPGTYTVVFTAIDSSSCNISDTAHLIIKVLPQPQINLGNDTTLCGTPNMTLNAGTSGNIYSWSTGATSQTIIANSIGDYWVTISNGTCSASDTISILLLTQPSLGNDTSLCSGQSLTLNSGNTGATYLWSTGAVSQTINVTTSGQYWVTVSSGACQLSDTMNVTFLPNPVVNLGNDTTVCLSSVITLDAGNPGSTYLWSTGAVTQTININTIGTYYVTVSNGQCSKKDTINIQLLTQLSLGNDTTLCTGQSLTLNAFVPGATYLWSTGATTPAIHLSLPGQYSVITNLGSCQTFDTVNVNYISYPVINLPSSSSICPNSSVILDAGAPATSYLWSTGATTQTITVSSGGTFSVVVANAQCKISDTTIVKSVEPIAWENSAMLCSVDKYTLDAGTSGATYLWSTGATTQTIDVTESGIYWVVMNKENCLLSDTILLDGGLGAGVVWFPNSFTPNGNELNDIFTGIGIDITYFHLTIFDRWGELVFESETEDTGWNGTYKGAVVKQDVYVWKLQYKTKCTQDKLNTRLGHVTVVY